MEYNWKKELQAPELTNDFKWRFAVDNLKPKMEIEGPSVGSLLYAMNPKTSELGLKQMDSELNQQLAANSNFDKRGDAAMRFMEQRVAEDIAAKQFADKMDMERIKAQNVDAGHVNSLMSNYVQALNTGNADAISLLENQIRQTLPNAEQILAQGKETAALSNAQKQKYNSMDAILPRKTYFADSNERKSKLDEVKMAEDNGEINADQANDLRKTIWSIPDIKSMLDLESRKAYINAKASYTGKRTTAKLEVQGFEEWRKEQAAKGRVYKSDKAAREAYNTEVLGGGLK